MAQLKMENSKGSTIKIKIHIQSNVRLTTDFCRNFSSRREWHDIFMMLKRKRLKPQLFYPARLSFRIGERKNFSDKQNGVHKC